MTIASPALSSGGITGTFRRATDWLDARGKGAWIATMILAFVFVWPLGLAILGYMIWSKRMFTCRNRSHDRSFGPFGSDTRDDIRAYMRNLRTASRPSGNAAFDAYKADTLRRLEDEQQAFESFLHRLREAKDKQEFDSFMTERAKAAATGADQDPDQDQGVTPKSTDVKRPGEY